MEGTAIGEVHLPRLLPFTRRLFALILVSAAVLNFEVVLTRHIAITHWHHLTTVVIAIALLGFGMGGSIATVVTQRLKRAPQSWLPALASTACISFVLSQLLALHIPLNMLALPWHINQYAYLLVYAMCWLPPFLFSGLFIVATFICWPNEIPKLYGADLLGAALGAVLAIALLESNHFLWAFKLSPALALLAALLCLSWPPSEKWLVVFGLLCLLVLVQYQPNTTANAFKSESIRLNEADAEKLWQHDSADSRLSILKTPGQHASPGQSINSSLGPLKQWQLYIDGDHSIPLLLSGANKQTTSVLTQSIHAAPYQIMARPANVLLLASNPSWNSWTAFAHKAKSITILDQHRHLAPLLEAGKDLAIREGVESAASALAPSTVVVGQPPRRFFITSKQEFDLILTSVDSHLMGSSATKANYLLTQEGMEAAFGRLSKHGILAFYNIMLPIPKDNVRMFNTVATWLRQANLPAKQHVAVLRDWRSMMIMISKQAIPKKLYGQLHHWSQHWHFDIVALPGSSQTQSNQYHIKSGTSYFELFQRLNDPGREEFFQTFIFDLSPPTDDRPYFYHGIHRQTLEHLVDNPQHQWPLILGWGYLLTLASLVLVIPLAIVFIFAPLKLVYAKQHFDKVPLAVLGYFTCIGIGFMSIEIALLERVYLLLDSRTITLATVLSAMLIGSGLGSVALGQRKWTANKILLLVATFSFPLLYLFFWFEQVFEATSLWLWPSRLLFAFCMILAISVPLGVFMPHGLRQLASQQSMLIAWCWGINGFASVFGVLLAPLIALEIGLSGLLLTGLSCYVFAALLFKHYEAKRILP